MRVSLVTRIFAGYFLVLCLLGGVAVYSVMTMKRMQEEVTIVKQGLLPISARLQKLSRELSQTSALLRSKSCEGAIWVAHYLPETNAFHTLESIADSLNKLGESPHLAGASRKLFERVAEQTRGVTRGKGLFAVTAARLVQQGISLPGPGNRVFFAALVQEFLETASRAPEAQDRSDQQIHEALREATQLLRRKVMGFDASCSLAMNRAWSETREEEQDAFRMTLYLGGAGIAVTVAVFFLLLSWLRPLSTLRSLAQRIARGDYDRPVRIVSGDEIGQLSDELNKMAARLKEREDMIRRQAEELVRADRFSTIGKMATQIAHEVRNPLNALGLKLELLGEQIDEVRPNLSPEGFDTLHDAVVAGGREIDRLSEITDYYLKFAKFPQVEKEMVDLSVVLSDVLTFYEQEAAQTEVRMVREIERPLRVRADPNLVRHALANLLKNAIDATSQRPEEGTIALKAWKENQEVRITVKDNGPGIPAAEVNRVFEPFFSTKKSGTGLGLTLVQQIVNEHGGSIGCTSTQGEGTMFKLSIPE